MLDKLKSVWNVFKQGQAVANPAAWKRGQITATMLGGFFIAIVQLAKAFGHDIPLDADTSTAIAGGIVAGVNWLLTIVTTDKIGIVNQQITDSVLSGQPSQGDVSQPTAKEEAPKAMQSKSEVVAEDNTRDYIN